MTTEQKAKAYDEAYKKVAVRFGSNVADEIFLKESEDEKIRNFLIKCVNENMFVKPFNTDGVDKQTILAWLEKQGEHANFINKIQIGDKVTRNEDGVLVNLSQLKRVAKKDEKQGNNMGISEATKQKLEDNLKKALEKETPESFNEFLEKQGEQKPADDIERKYNPCYNMSFEEAQEYISNRSFDIPWTDCDVFVDFRYVTQTVANILRWADDNPRQKPVKWSEEDETIAKALTKAANDNVLYGYIGKSKLLDWLKSLKDRVQLK